MTRTWKTEVTMSLEVESKGRVLVVCVGRFGGGTWNVTAMESSIDVDVEQMPTIVGEHESPVTALQQADAYAEEWLKRSQR